MTIAAALAAAAARHPTPGFVAAATRAGKPLYSGAFGTLAADAPAPMRDDAIFWIASMTKAVTATAAMQLPCGFRARRSTSHRCLARTARGYFDGGSRIRGFRPQARAWRWGVAHSRRSILARFSRAFLRMGGRSG